MEDYKAKKLENKKVKTKNYDQNNKEKMQKRFQEYQEYYLSEDKIKKKGIMLTLAIEICQTQIRKEEYMNNFNYKTKNLLNHAINDVEEL